MDDTWRSKVDERLTGLEKEVHGVTIALDWVKIGFGLVLAVMLSGFALLSTQMSTQVTSLGTRIDGLTAKLSDEFRAQRAEAAAQTSAIANAVTATRQQAPQVILVPPPAPQAAPKP